MCQLTEAIKVFDGKIFNVDLHSERLNRARKDLFGPVDEIHLEEILNIPDYAGKGLFKCRITYAEEINKIEWLAYKQRNIKTLKLVRGDDTEYSYKFNDRRGFEKLLKENNCSEHDAIIIVKEKRVTDTHFSNIVMFNGKEWHTPLHPLLIGTKRAELLRDGIISEKDISASDFYNYEKVKLINAMMDYETSPVFMVKDVLPMKP